MAFAVKEIMRKLKSRFEEEDIELTLEQYFILNILDNEEGLILQELADIVDRDKSAVLRLINGLENNHFVARTKDTNDRRRKILLVTKAGSKILEKAHTIDHEVNEAITHQLSSKETENLENILGQIYRNAMPKTER